MSTVGVEKFDHGNPSLSFRQILFAVLLVLVAAAVLGSSQFFIGPNTATSGYLTILFLLSVVRATTWRARFIATGWSLAVALLGYVVGTLGLGFTLVALVLVSLVQGFVMLGETAFLTRSPVNLLAFAALAQGGAEVWTVLLGSLIGAIVIWIFAAVANTRSERPEKTTSLAERIGYSLATAAGSLIIVIGSDLVGFPHAGWALLSFALILSVGADERATRSYLRLWGSVIGAFVAVLVATLPAPVPTIVAVVCAVLCVAYVNAGKYGYFVLFLTPVILLTTQSELSLVELGVYRIEALAFATVLALVCSVVIRWSTRRWEKRHPAAEPEHQPDETV